MTAVMVVVGLLVVGTALIDQAWTTVAAGHGGGPLTRRLAAVLWRLALWLHGRRPRGSVLAVAGPVIVFAVFGAWVATVLVGWSLVFLSGDDAVRSSTTGMPGDIVDRLYFTGFTVFTLGVGDFRPGAGIWQLATVAATASGLVLVTLGITYLVPVASAVTERRTLASSIAALGDDGEAMVVRAWNGRDFGGLAQQLASLAMPLESTRQHHLTYPVLHYFHSVSGLSAAPVQVVHLAQALEALRLGVAPAARPDKMMLEPVDRAVESFLDTLADAYIRPHDEAVEAVSLETLRAAAIPTISDDEYEAALAGTERRRRLLAALLLDDGWPLPSTTAPGSRST